MKVIFLLSFVLFAIPGIAQQTTPSDKLCQAAIELTHHHVVYDAAYTCIPYPDGDVAADKGVCTDVVVRAYRQLNIDLQKEVHVDMTQNFSLYPKTWRAVKPDANIDHRRVPNLMVYFSRKGETKTVSQNPNDYKPGDIVTWDLGGGMTHIGIVINQKSADNQRYLVVHNIGRGQEISDCLFLYKLIGHYRYKI